MVATLFANLINMAFQGETSIKHKSKIANFSTGESLFPSILIRNKGDSNLRCSTKPNNLNSFLDGMSLSLLAAIQSKTDFKQFWSWGMKVEAFSGVMPTYICVLSAYRWSLITQKPEIIALKGPLYIVKRSGLSSVPLGTPQFNSLNWRLRPEH